MLCDLYLNAYDYEHVFIDPEYYALDSVDTVEDGVVLRQSVVKPVSVAKEFAGFSCHDFDISTVISTGSDKLLRPVQFRNADVASASQAMSNVIKMFDADEEAV